MMNDKTNTALLLSGSWGSGKTYYVKNSLIPFLNGNEKKVVYISMYGIKSAEALESCKNFV